MLGSSSTDALARFGRALSDPTRIPVLDELAERLGVSRQAFSNHLAWLRGCGLVVTR